MILTSRISFNHSVIQQVMINQNVNAVRECCLNIMERKYFASHFGTDLKRFDMGNVYFISFLLAYF